ncbi:alpha/beta fold hydrolase [Steroidobacter sp.]|uniref:alpha/beta fold hydrolase n=1 Tax=Steroidobacter sp. TaxID=1978227 RepID=UPI001A3FBDCE|nr:alpha/beta fold hydrolase [Steroidobacter sp.]MBL8269511.1 alpha/beta fold hydrolase [Steroidobacter sp.]
MDVLSVLVMVAANVLAPCQLPGIAEAAQCAVVDVPENPAKPDGRRLGISVGVLPAHGQALPDPILILMGGPGEEAIGAAADFAKLLAPLRRDRDLLFIDQRGTGKSHRLGCDIYAGQSAQAIFRDVFPQATIEKCAIELSRGADLTQYSYAHFARDLEHIRRLLGYAPMNLFAGSYGTRAAQVFIKTHPDSVRTVFMWSIVPIDVAIPLPMSKAAQSAMDKVLAACETQPECRTAFPNVRDELVQVMQRLDAGKVVVSIPGQVEQVTLNRGRIAERLRSMMYRADGADAIPYAIHRAYLGDYRSITNDLLENARSISSALSFGLFFSIGCNEDIPFIVESEIAAATAGTYIGDYRVRQQQAACAKWPKASLPAGYRDPVHSSVPALFVSGDTDPASPLWFTEHASKGFTNRAEVVLNARGHTEWRDCVADIYRRFVSAGSVTNLVTSTCKSEPRRPFKT